MTKAQSFPLLRLPSLAREHVVKIMDVREQYLFSTLSKKSKSVAKNGIRLISYVFSLRIRPTETCFNIRKNWSSQWFYIKIFPNGSNDKISDPSSEFQLNVEDTNETSIELLELLNGQFKISNISVHISDVPNGYTKRVVDVLRKLEISIYELGVFGEEGEIDNEMYKWVMDDCQDAKRLSNYCEPSVEFQWDSQKQFAPEYCLLNYAPWLTFDHLTRIFINCRFFQSSELNVHLTEAELNQFVKIWIENSKLEFVYLNLQNRCSIRRVLRDIGKEPVRRAYVENELQGFNAGEAYKIQQKSGNEAVVFIEEVYENYLFHITTHFNNRKCDFWDVEEEEELDLEEDEDEEDEEDEEFEDEEDEEEEEEDN